MLKKNSSKILVGLSICLIFETLSFLGLYFPLVNQLAFILLVAIILGLSIYRLEYGLLLAAAELFVGSMGHLFTYPLLFGGLSIRMAFWAAVMAVFALKFLGQIIKSGQGSKYYQNLKNFPDLKYFGWLGFFILLALINGLARGHSLSVIFLDFNAWLYFLLIFPAVAVYSQADKTTFNNLKIVFVASSLWLSLETLFLLFVFTHNLNIGSDIYLWLRRTIVGEMTATKGGWPRVFIQGQIFPLIAYLLIFWRKLNVWSKTKFFSKTNWQFFGAAALFFGTALVSFSRSFWVGLLAAALFSIVIVFFSVSKKRAVIMAGWLITTALAGLALIYLTAIFPYPAAGKFNADFLNRLSNGNEAAISSRWSLLPVLAGEISKNPWLGQGYGATVTYLSSDPRILEKSPTGEYTTSAFEWGYLDLWLKFGSFGLAAYLLLIFILIRRGWRLFREKGDYLAIGLGSGLVFLAAVNLFTPYLNHPLGIGFLILSSCLISLDRV